MRKNRTEFNPEKQIHKLKLRRHSSFEYIHGLTLSMSACFRFNFSPSIIYPFRIDDIENGKFSTHRCQRRGEQKAVKFVCGIPTNFEYYWNSMNSTKSIHGLRMFASSRGTISDIIFAFQWWRWKPKRNKIKCIYRCMRSPLECYRKRIKSKFTSPDQLFSRETDQVDLVGSVKKIVGRAVPELWVEALLLTF